MTKISRNPVDRKKMGNFIDDFWTVTASLKDKKETKDFFNLFLSPTEKKMFAKRFQIMMMLYLGYDYEQIMNRTKVSSATISKINNLMGEDENVLGNMSGRILRLKQIKQENFGKRRLIRESATETLLKAGAGKIVGKVRDISKQKSLTD